MLRYLFCILFFLQSSLLAAQNIVVKHFTVNDGLPSHTIYNAVQDKDGFIWLATEAGVSRFDGSRFTNFTITDGLTDNEVIRTYKDSKGRVWFLGLNGTVSYYENGVFNTSLNNPILQKLPNDRTYTYLYEDNRGRIWLTRHGTYAMMEGSNVFIFSDSVEHEGIVMDDHNKGVYFISDERTDNKSLIHLSANHKIRYYPCRFQKKKDNGFTYLNDGSVLFRSNNQIIHQQDTSQTVVLQLDKDFSKVSALQMFLSKDNYLWLTAGEQGVLCYEYANLQKRPIQYLKGINATSIMEDNEGNIWVSTFNDGLYLLQPHAAVLHQYFSAGGNENGHIYAVMKDKDGKIYAGMDKGRVNVINPNGKSTILQVDNSIGSLNCVTTIVNNDEHIFFGTENLIARYDKKEKKLKYPSLFFRNRKQNRIGVKNACVYNKWLIITSSYYFDTLSVNASNNISNYDILNKDNNRCYTVFAGKNNILWFSNAKGLHSFDGKEVKVHDALNKYLFEKIQSINQTSDSTLVLGTYGQGLLFYKNGKLITNYTQFDGLAGNICKKVFVNNDEVYVATTGGVTAFKYDDGGMYGIRQFTTNNGLLSNDVYDVFADSNELCIATSNGLTILDPAKVFNIVSPPPIFITNVKCNGKSLSFDSLKQLNYQQNSLHISYIAISFKNANEVVYQYKLNNSEHWVETKNTSVDFSFLPPGNYTFSIRASIQNGNWGNPKEISFSIAPPFWKTNFFIVFSILFTVLVVVLSVRYLVKEQGKYREEELRIENQIINLEQQALLAMMNPHFIFNVMNSIQHYINTNNAQEANEYLTNFAQLIRMNLDISSKQYIPLEEEITYLELYLSLEKLRFGDRLSYSITVAPDIDTDDILVPVMLLQPFIENALWHGILPKQGAGTITISISKLPDNLLSIIITDDGIGMPADMNENAQRKSHTSKGMKMTEQRMILLQKIAHRSLSLIISDAFPNDENRGTRVEMTLPSNLS